jgi:chromosome segregation protein
VQSELAGLEARGRELARQAEKHQLSAEELQRQRHELARQQGDLRQQQGELAAADDRSSLEQAEGECRAAEAAVELSRRRLGEVAGRSGSWLEEQKQRSRQRQELQGQVSPRLAEQQQLSERLRQEQERLAELRQQLEDAATNSQGVASSLSQLEEEWLLLLNALQAEQTKAQELVEALALQQRTRQRLEQEQSSLEREIARLESRRETLQESRGTGALRLLLEAGLEGIHGPVAQLGEVEDAHRLALEVAAGARLGQVVVDDDRIAARAIDLLKSRRAGRLTFLPLNKIRGGGGAGAGAAFERGTAAGRSGGGDGLVGRAVELVRFEAVYGEVFRYVFGDTLVFRDLASARRELGRCRAVTLDGELLEKSGAMTGGSFQQRGNQLSFGTASDNDEAEPLRRRLLELGATLVASRRKEAELGRQLEELRPLLSRQEQRRAALEAERKASQRSHGPLLQRREQLSQRIGQIEAELQAAQERLMALATELAPLQQQLSSLESAEATAQASGDSERWQGLQQELESADQQLTEARRRRDDLLAARRERGLAAERVASQLQALGADEQRLAQAVNALVAERSQWKEQQQADQQQRAALEERQQELQARFGERRRARDEAETQLSNQRQALQQKEWELQRLGEELLSLGEQRRSATLRLDQLEKELPDPLPEVPAEVRENGLEALQAELRSLQQRMEALEPVNMLALQELEDLEQRLADLQERLDVLCKEREELLLRIETVATLRQEAFMEAFTAVDGHFREIFAGLSDGEGFLQLENPQDPLEGGLSLVAHPKGKAVRRLASMSGGEKSLTALSFLFALQRFRPSPFYALDEVDSFLDGVNVERLAALIARQADQAQFMVVSHRRPMIAAATRTIGVTQARGAHTQVVGLPPAA